MLPLHPWFDNWYKIGVFFLYNWMFHMSVTRSTLSHMVQGLIEAAYMFVANKHGYLQIFIFKRGMFRLQTTKVDK